MDQSQVTRLVQAIKGTSRLSDPKARIVVSSATTRELLTETGLASTGSVMARGSVLGLSTIVSITDTTGNLFCLLDVEGAADGATLS